MATSTYRYTTFQTRETAIRSEVSPIFAAAAGCGPSYTYDSFGNQTASSGSLTNFFRYTGREFDTETNLYYYRARYYDSNSGRFVQEDPIRFGSEQVNFYAYIGNEPVNYFDPYGLKCVTKMMVVTAYSDTGPAKDWNYLKQTGNGGGPGIVAVANTSPQPYPMGSTVTVSGNPDPFFNSQPTDPFNLPAYNGIVHDTGRGWNYPGHVPIAPNDWIDIWLPKPDAKKWGRQWRRSPFAPQTPPVNQIC